MSKIQVAVFTAAYSFLLLMVLINTSTHAFAEVSAHVDLKAEYDSNVLSKNDLITEYKSDWASNWSAGVGGDVQLGKTIRVQGQYDFSQTQWLTAQQYNTKIHSGFVRTSTRIGRWTPEIIVLTAYAQVDNQDFLTLNRGSVAINYLLNSSVYTRLQVDGGQKSFPMFPARDAKFITINPSGYWMISNMDHFFKLQVKGLAEEANDSQYHKLSYQANLLWSYRFSSLRIWLESGYQRNEFINIWPSINDARRDERFKQQIGLEFEVTDAFTLIAELGHDLFESNLPSSNYDQQRGLIQLTYHW